MAEESGTQAHEKALKAALRLLRFRPRSVWELSTRLRQTFREETCRTVIQELRRKELLGDDAFSKFWIENRLQFKQMGKMRLIQELLAKRVDQGVIQEALDTLYPGEDRLIAERLLEAQRRKMDPRDPKQAQRMYRFLRSRGFAHDLVTELLEKDVQENKP